MTVFTAIIGPYEDLKEPLVVTPHWQYICFTDQPFKSNIWDIRQVHAGDPQRTARQYKILNPLHAEMYIDGSFTINCDLNEFWNKYYKPPFSVPIHPFRDCVYEECATCVMNKRGNNRDIQAQMHAYKMMKMPRHNGLISSGVLLRNDSVLVKEWCEKWYNELTIRSTRDQLAFAYAAWKYGAIHNTFKWYYVTAQDLIFQTHYHRRKDGITHTN